MKIEKGVATWAGLVAALGQYMAAVAVFLEADNQSDALGPLVTATATLLAVIVGRMQQAKALAARPAAPPPSVYAGTGATTSTTTGWSNHVQPVFYTEKRGKTPALGEPTDLSLEIPGGGFPQDGERP